MKINYEETKKTKISSVLPSCSSFFSLRLIGRDGRGTPVAESKY
jgi:hypothetical protein